MKLIRTPFLLRTVAVYFILSLSLDIVFPVISLALTNGPHQPDYTGYEEPGIRDMVNLTTGDFSYRIPAITIPGPEGGFSMPLSYKAGIGLNQEASWVGLGWSLNAGAITRNVVSHPDDAMGEVLQIHRANNNVERGWNASIPGVGSIGWNTNDGHTGRISILGLQGFSYSNGSITGGNFVGFDFNSKGVTADPVAVASAAITIATLGTAGPGLEVAKTAAIQVGFEAVAIAAVGVAAPSLGAQGYWKHSVSKDRRLFHTNYKVYLDQTRYEDMYGVLYLGEQPRGYYDVSTPKISTGFGEVTPAYVNDATTLAEDGASSDMHYDFDGLNYIASSSPSSLAKDSYSVMGQGISGTIEPYRADIGTLSFPRQMSPNHIRLALFPWRTVTWPTSYKTQFRYRGSISNAYYHHVGGQGTRDDYTIDIDNPKHGVEHTFDTDFSLTNRSLLYSASDPILPEYYQFNGAGSIHEADRTGLTDGKLSQERNIQWYSNTEIVNGGATGFIDCFSTASRQASFDVNTRFEVAFNWKDDDTNKLKVGPNATKYFENNDNVVINGIKKVPDPTIVPEGYQLVPFELETQIVQVNKTEGTVEVTSDLPQVITQGIVSTTRVRVNGNTVGGYSITREDGRTYHYALPIYEWNNTTYIQDVSDADNITTLNRIEPFPTTWLLTSITGSDYVDRNSNGEFDNADWGYWVKFNYGKFSNDYHWRLPYEGMTVSADGTSKTYQKGQRQQYYLNSIETRTHVGLFIKYLRLDARDAQQETPSSSLRLDDFVLLKRHDYEGLLSLGFSEDNNEDNAQIANNSDNLEEIIDVEDIDVTQGNFIIEKQLRRVRFNYDYSLVQNTPNSFAMVGGNKTSTSTTGKLTLKSLTITGRNYVKLAPDFEFDYGNNPEYHKHKWDGWGYYNSNGTAAHDTHTSSNSDADGRAWSLNSVLTPLGNELKIEYERDSYSSISGNAISEKKGEGIRVKSIETTDGITSFKTRYDYNNSTGQTSGVVAMEPPYIQQTDYDFYGLFDYPSTPVMYGTVNVYDGKNASDNDYHTKQQYKFITPHHDMVQETKTEIFNAKIIQDHLRSEYLNKSLHEVDIRTGQIGKPLSVSVYDDSDNLIVHTEYDYADDIINDNYANQGVYTEGSFLMERVVDNNADFAPVYHRSLKTIKRYYPNSLMSVTSTNSDGFVTTTINQKWDFKTGIVKEVETTSPSGIKTLTEKVLSHEFYPEMGFKQESVDNAHMVGGTVATYSYKLNGAGVKTGLIGSSVQTWKKDWDTFREVNGSGDFEDVAVLPDHQRWRASTPYIYQGETSNEVQDDGTLFFDESNRFDFSSDVYDGFQNGTEVLRYDFYSMPLEQVDINGNYASTKTSLAKDRKVLETVNARFTETAFSGVENQVEVINGTRYADGEVRIASVGAISDEEAHTGKKSLKLTSNGAKGFYYKMTAGEFDPNRNYKVSIWIKTAPALVQLYYKLGTSTVNLTSKIHQAGEEGIWYRVEALIPASALSGGQTLEVGAKSVSASTIYLDDFRFQPIDANSSAYIYDDQDRLWYVLDNENLFTEYEYNTRGQLVKTYRETFTYGRVLLTETETHYSRDGE